MLKRYRKAALREYLKNNLKESSDESYPDRTYFKPTRKKLADGTHISIAPYETEVFNSLLFRMRTGHTYTNYHLSKITNIDSACNHCENEDKPEEDQTLEHVLLECNANASEELTGLRNKYKETIGRLYSLNQNLWENPKEMIELARQAKKDGYSI